MFTDHTNSTSIQLQRHAVVAYRHLFDEDSVAVQHDSGCLCHYTEFQIRIHWENLHHTGLCCEYNKLLHNANKFNIIGPSCKK